MTTRPTRAQIEAAMRLLPNAIEVLAMLTRADGGSVTLQVAEQPGPVQVVVITLIDQPKSVERIVELLQMETAAQGARPVEVENHNPSSHASLIAAVARLLELWDGQGGFTPADMEALRAPLDEARKLTRAPLDEAPPA
jgi:hypothetical protein